MFTPIDPAACPRREHFSDYRNVLPRDYGVTVRPDVTRFRAIVTHPADGWHTAELFRNLQARPHTVTLTLEGSFPAPVQP